MPDFSSSFSPDPGQPSHSTDQSESNKAPNSQQIYELRPALESVYRRSYDPLKTVWLLEHAREYLPGRMLVMTQPERVGFQGIKGTIFQAIRVFLESARRVAVGINCRLYDLKMLKSRHRQAPRTQRH